MEPNELRAAIEAILFISNEPVRTEDLAEAFADDGGLDAVIAQIEEIRRTLDANVGGFMLEQAGGGWRFATRAEHEPTLKKYFDRKGQNRLSIAALETLAIVAYRQPITAPEVSELRSVSSNAVIRTLLERHMIRVAGRKNVVGSPFLYKTTKDFLLKEGTDLKYGARHLKRSIERHLVYPLSNLIATGQIGMGDVIKIDLGASGDKLTAAL